MPPPPARVWTPPPWQASPWPAGCSAFKPTPPASPAPPSQPCKTRGSLATTPQKLVSANGSGPIIRLDGRKHRRYLSNQCDRYHKRHAGAAKRRIKNAARQQGGKSRCIQQLESVLVAPRSC